MSNSVTTSGGSNQTAINANNTGATSNEFQQASPLGGSQLGMSGDKHSWYEAMAGAWGNALDQQADQVTQLSDAVSNGGKDTPSAMTQLTAESMKMQFMANNASTATSSVGQALEALARK
ncbi:hypothetical protein OLMES_5455 [Oleiphilus messinensis]|uniref:Uncharacterized protein n=1 Tax=Oleiphilus messinensis TaxID=141451 RepID=A0A1Y0IIT7_9GAMM|nr:hypothetical protein [Oleiphilus messinensis]ARU59435.1 hypothetical protein OLMES_5455 [Oleiphilus messinensis]